MIVATDLETGTKLVLKSGCTIDALGANITIPGVFAPVRVKNHWLTGIVRLDPVSVSVARAMVAEVVIAANLNSPIVSRKKQEKKSRPPSKETDWMPQSSGLSFSRTGCRAP